MDVDTTRPVDQIRRITRASDARELALTAYERFADLLDTLGPEDWQAPTECPGWDVAAMVGHVIGAGKAGASLRENLRQQAWGARHKAEFDGNALDAANDRQVRDHAELTPTERTAAVRAVGPAAVRGRLRLPRPLRSLSVALDPGGSTATGMPTRLQLGHLVDVIYTRDVWLHTIDIARATGRPYVPDPAFDGRLVEDVVAEWAARHGRPFVLELPGAMALRFRSGEGGGHLRLDAIELCRVLSGRAEVGDADVEVDAEPADTLRLLDTRVLF